MKLIRKIIHDLLMIMIPKGIRKNMLSCEEVSHIIAEDDDLKSIKKIKLKMHLFICQKCLDYKKQIQFINQNAKKIKLSNLENDLANKIEESKNSLIDKHSNK